MSGIVPRLMVLIAAVTAGAVAVAGAAVAMWGDAAVGFLAAVTLLAVVSEVFDFAPFPNCRVSLSIALILAAGTLEGLQGVVVVAPAAAAADCAVHRKPAARAVYNAATLVLSGAAFVAVLEALGPLYNGSNLGETLGPALAGSIAAYAVNSGLVAMAIALQTGESAVRAWDERFRWLLPHYVLLGAIAVFTAFAYDRWELAGIAVVIAPLAASWLIIKQFARRTRTATGAAGSAPHS